MAGEAIAWRNYLTQVLHLNGEQTLAFTNQGYSSYQLLQNVGDEDIEATCRLIARPGGTIPNPALALFDDPDDIPDDMPEDIPNPGVAFGHGHQARLKMFAFWCNYLIWTKRIFEPGQATLARITKLYAFKQQLDAKIESDKPKYPEKFAETKRARDILEDMNEWIDSSFGDKFPLSYIVRPDPAVPPGNRFADNPIGAPSYMEDLVTRLTHFDPVTNEYDPDYVTHNSDVWEMVYAVTHGTTAWSWVKEYKRSRDGRGAMLSLQSHYLGASHVNSVKTIADNTLNKVYWSGNSRNFSFDQFTSKLNDAFTDLAENGEPKTEEEKVRRLLSKITDAKLKVAVATIQASLVLYTNYQASLDFLKGQVDLNYAASGRDEHYNRRISEVGRGGRYGNNRGGGRNNSRGSGGNDYGGRYNRGGGGRYNNGNRGASKVPKNQP